MHYRVRIFDLNNKSNSPMEINFTAGWLMARIYAVIGTVVLFKHYYKYLQLGARADEGTYDVILFDKKTGKDIIALYVDEDESLDNFSYSL